jgi:hypothetical protein
MLSWFFGADTRAILTMSSSALGVTQVSCTFITMCNAENTGSAEMDQCTEQHRSLYIYQQL